MSVGILVWMLNHPMEMRTNKEHGYHLLYHSYDSLKHSSLVSRLCCWVIYIITDVVSLYIINSYCTSNKASKTGTQLIDHFGLHPPLEIRNNQIF